MKRYETIYITHPELSEEEISELQQKIGSILTSYKGDLVKLEDWGTKKLTYEIRKNTRGHFFLMEYVSNPDLIRELERNLRLNDRVLRFQTVRTSDHVSPEALLAIKDSATADKVAKVTEKPPEPPSPEKAPEQAVPEGGERA